MDARHLRTISAITGLLALSGSLGCTSLQTPTLGWGKTSLWGASAQVIKTEQADLPKEAAPAGKFIVEVRDSGGKSSSSEHNLAGPLNAHDALQQASAIKKFNRIKVELVRPLPNGGWHRMPMEYDRSIRRIPAECDYGILPGDRLIVTEDTGNMFTDMMESTQNGLFQGKSTSGKTKSGTFRVAG